MKKYLGLFILCAIPFAACADSDEAVVQGVPADSGADAKKDSAADSSTKEDASESKDAGSKDSGKDTGTNTKDGGVKDSGTSSGTVDECDPSDPGIATQLAGLFTGGGLPPLCSTGCDAVTECCLKTGLGVDVCLDK